MTLGTFVILCKNGCQSLFSQLQFHVPYVTLVHFNVINIFETCNYLEKPPSEKSSGF